jgi:hypothetical protein
MIIYYDTQRPLLTQYADKNLKTLYDNRIYKKQNDANPRNSDL